MFENFDPEEAFVKMWNDIAPAEEENQVDPNYAHLDPSCLDLNDPDTDVTTRQRKQPQTFSLATTHKMPDTIFCQMVYTLNLNHGNLADCVYKCKTDTNIQPQKTESTTFLHLRKWEWRCWQNTSCKYNLPSYSKSVSFSRTIS